MTIAGDGEYLTGLWFDGQKYYGSTIEPDAVRGDCAVFGEVRRWLDTYFGGGHPDRMPPLRLSGTPFRQQVWRVLCRIPYGTVVTYKQVAEAVARATGRERVPARAVGGAVAHNPVAIVVPCHRVVACGGHLTGYAGTLPRKRALLALEGADVPLFPAEDVRERTAVRGGGRNRP